MGKLKGFFLFLFFLAVVAAVGWFLLPFFKSSNALLQVNTPGVKSKVFIDGKLFGETPFLGKNLRVGDYKLQLEGQITKPVTKAVKFSTTITLTSQALTAVNYNFGPNEKFSSGDIRTLKDGSGLSIVTTPIGAEVWLDGKQVGKSPLTLEPSQGIHKIKVAKDGFISRELTVNVERNFRLVVEVFLAEKPADKVTEIEEGPFQVYSILTSQKSLLSDPESWSEGVFFFAKDIGVSFDCLIDQTGKTYYANKTTFNEKVKKSEAAIFGYLSATENPSPTADATAALAKIKGEAGQVAAAAATPQTTSQVEILNTPIGTLNVRSGPNTSFSIITKVNPGEKYQLLEESPGWYKIKTASGEGWISAQYAKKL